MRKNRRNHHKQVIVTGHAVDQAVARWGRQPTQEEIAEILRHSACALKCEVVMRQNGQPWVMPGIYINFDAGIALHLDETGPVDRVMTVLTRANQR